MDNEINQIALYQKWPSKTQGRFGICDTTEPTLAISIFPATNEGLEQAIGIATRADAKLVRITKLFFCDKQLQSHIERRIRDDKFVALFRPLKKVPGEKK